MRNSFLPPLPSQSVFSFGNEFRMPSLDICSILGTKINAHTDSLWSLPRLFNDEETMKEANLGTNYFHPIIFSSPQTDYQNTLFDHDINADELQGQRRKHLGRTSKSAQLNVKDCPLEMAIESDHRIPEKCEAKAISDHWKNKRKRAFCSQQFHPHAIRNSAADPHTSNVTVRRSQKIGDKVTALQKLVSPYGKTDTASVLQEASLYIKLLQEQIQHLYQMLGSSCTGIRPIQAQEYGKQQKPIDLRSRGLCLVPVSTAQEVTGETKIDNQSTYSYLH